MQPPPQSRLTIDLDALGQNWRTLSGLAGRPVGAAIKADGYGLGAQAVMARLAAEGARDFFVASWREAAELGALPGGVTLHVLHGVSRSEAAYAATHPATPVLNSAEQCALWQDVAPGRAADLMVDTGINRLGLPQGELAAAAGLSIDVLMSHFACADEAGHPATAHQVRALAQVDVPAARRSIANSAGLFEDAAYALDLARPGLALYGGEPHPAASGRLRQVAHLEARVLQLRHLQPGDRVGYGGTFAATRPTDLAVLGLGYADGYRRALSGKGAALVDGVRCPVLGRVSMDLVAIDVTGLSVGPDDWVEIAFDLPQAAAAAGLAQYELLTGLGVRMERRYMGARA